MQKILGISCFYHDSAAALLVGGKLVAAAQEERFSRLKHDPAFPAQAIQSCLDQAGLTLADIDAVVFYDKPLLKFERLLETFLAHAPFGLPAFCRAMPVWLKEKLLLKTVLRQELMALSGLAKTALPKLLFSQHHQAHAASAFYPSPFSRAAVLCLDGVGEWVSASIWLGENEQLTPLSEQHFPHSPGLLYSAFTSYCGFKVNSGEYKLMGLAPYGEPVYVDLIYQHLLTLHEDGSFVLNPDYFDFAVGKRMTSSKFHRLFGGQPRRADEPISQKQMDLARSIQQVIEDIVLKMAWHAKQLTGCQAVCLAGGVALNCVANGRLMREGPFKQVWIQPAAGDAGGAVGAAYLAWHQYAGQPRQLAAGAPDQMQGSYLGPEYSDAAIEQQLQAQQLSYVRLTDQELHPQVADLLANGKVVGWFQGRMEFGPRALGNRSILGDPRSPQMQSVLNLKIKNRESFRPFAPAVLQEMASRYFQLIGTSPYMLLCCQLRPELLLPLAEAAPVSSGFARLAEQRSTLPAITHVDLSARVQTVDASTNPRFHALLQAFYQQAGVAVLINTSFNVRGEPPVCSPKDAIEGFLATDMDVLVLGNYLLLKKNQPQAAIDRARAREFADD
ncbi:hypothetical protein EOE67_19895 [Rheinheimera riviphila]|uniref:Carbamoyltransferase n=1 Tax=Rheinheimera riviphila TaxID=1834037 RepID=A0A437QBS4_9GAMM|nr:carbamoyltransferase [Rheinheimera riviphila]RVU31859.1 hypothetical protein EOE67_19895 [Rheinheimera riviphila]